MPRSSARIAAAQAKQKQDAEQAKLEAEQQQAEEKPPVKKSKNRKKTVAKKQPAEKTTAKKKLVAAQTHAQQPEIIPALAPKAKVTKAVKRGQVVEIWDEDPIDGYTHVNLKHPHIRKMRKMAMDRGEDVYEVKAWGPKYGRHYYPPATIGHFVPTDVYEECHEPEEAIAAKRQKRQDAEKNKIMREFDRQYPKMPQNVRDVVYAHAWAPHSNRVGRAANLDLATKVNYATEAHVLHNQTDYERDFQEGSDEAYEEFVGGRHHFDRDYEMFRETKAELMADLKNQYFPEAIAICANWK